MEFVQDEISKKFLEAASTLISKGLAKDDSELAKTIGWNKTSMSSARHCKINVPKKYINSLEKKYNVVVITTEEAKLFQDIHQRLLKAESHLEVFQEYIAEILARNKKEVKEKYDEIQASVDKVVNRRFDEFHKK